YLNDPIQGMEFLAPATVTMLASSWDNEAPMQVQFMVGNQVAATVTSNANPSDAANFMLRGMAQNLAAGTHELWVRETSRNGATHDSAHITITVKSPPTYAADHQLVLTADLMLSGDMQLLGTADQPFLIQGNGHSIVAPAGWAGHLTIRNAHVRDLGALAGSDPSPKALAINVQTTGGVDIQDSLFEHCGEVRVQADGNATVTFKGNTMNENTAVSVTSLSYAESSLAPPTPIVHFFGSSKAPKTFAGNRVYMGWSEFDNPHSWTIGGDTDADSNIMMGPRAGILMFQNQDGTGNNRVSGNYSVLHCPNRWTQCSNFIFSNAGRGNIVERNLLVGGWIIQGFAGELRYNVITTGGEDFMREFGDNTLIHHNVINYLGYLWPGDPSDVIDLYASNGVSAKGIEMFNNTFDGGGAALKLYGPAIRLRGVTVHSIRNNAFVHFPYYLGLVVSGIRDMETKAGPQPYADYLDYNAFFNPEKKAAAPLSYYLKTTSNAAAGSPGFGGHDVGGLNKDVDPLFSGKDTSGVYPFSRADIWARKAKVSLMLQYFANYYRPASGSPLTDAGDPADGDGTDVGAVDSGKPNSKYGGIADFGK
ncbi:MAG TPA: hypothetical protein VNO55_18600, partial [Polyangia bacterium]|nr:hypothetical protein [Polyangia bacterium]